MPPSPPTDAIQKEILRRLHALETREHVAVLYACESGSRAWGFASTNSDYDVRFIYTRRLDWYLSIDEGRDVIEAPILDDIDVSGWDLRKALQLLRKSNPPLLEWIQSPIIYRQQADFSQRFRKLANAFYSPKACVYHYLHMAEGNARHYFQKKSVQRKKYLYVLRPILACEWIEAGHGLAPIEFDRLVERMVPAGPVRDAIEDLIERKKRGEELDEGPKITILDEFIEKEITRLRGLADQFPCPEAAVEPLNEFFRSIVRGHGGTMPLPPT